MPKRIRAFDEETPEEDSAPVAKKSVRSAPAPFANLPSTSSPPSSTSPEDSVTTILSWNVETPVPFLDFNPRKITSYNLGSSSNTERNNNILRALLLRHQSPDFVCLQEVRARHTDMDWIAALKRAPNGSKDPKYTAYMSLNRASRGQRHFGVVTYVKDPSQVAVAREVEWDVEGRVMILEMKSGWALVNVYALNGSEYPWVDQRTPKTSTGKTRNQRKREFNKLLLKECKQMQERGLSIVLIGDFNISLAKRDCVPRLRTEFPHALARKEFNQEFIPGAGVVDIYREIHRDKKAFSWFARGKPQGSDCARVDYALVDRRLIGNVVENTYLEDPGERAHSDQAPLVLKLKRMERLKQ